jgi:threonine aldolase
MAERLRAGFGGTHGRVREAWPTGGNEIFAVLSEADAWRLRAAGAAFHEWPAPQGMEVALGGGEVIVRLVTAFSTRPEEVDTFLAALAET